MLKIEAVIHPSALDEIKTTLESMGIERVVTSNVLEHGNESAHKAFYRGTQYRVGAPMVKLELLVATERADEVIDAVMRVARTPKPAEDGTIMVFEVADAIRIRSGARLQYVLT
jgi:nitrogen regulatory protein P-II 1